MEGTRFDLAALLETLLASREPCGLACRLMATGLAEAAGLCEQLHRLADGLGPADANALRLDLVAVLHIRQQWRDGPVFSRRTRQQLGVVALPMMALSLMLLWQWLTQARRWQGVLSSCGPGRQRPPRYRAAASAPPVRGRLFG